MTDLKQKHAWCSRAVWMTVLLMYACVATADIPAGYNEYYIPGDEDQMWSLFESLDNDPDLDEADGIHCVISVVASTDDTVVYYDHWEDGYDFDPNDPENTYDEKYTLDAGEVQTLESSNIPVMPRGTAEHYDGRDRIYTAGGFATVSRASYPEDIGTVFALAWEILPVKAFGTDYVIPAGEDLGMGTITVNATDDFSTQAYNNNSADWDGNWTEVNDSGGATGGEIFVNSTSEVLSMNDDDDDTDTSDNYIYRQIDLGSVDNARLNFTWTTSTGVDSGDDVDCEVNEGGGWIHIDDFIGIVGAQSGSQSYDLADHLVNNLQIRWELETGYNNADEIYTIDNVEVIGGTGGFEDFYYVFTLVQAVNDGTVVTIDDPTTSGTDVSVTLNAGETTELFNLNAGTTINGSKPVQCVFVVGFPWRNSTFSEARGYSAIPKSIWDNSYYNPVDSFNTVLGTSAGAPDPPVETDIYTYNDNGTAIIVNREDTDGTGNFTINPSETVRYSDHKGTTLPVPENSGVYLFSDDKFWGIVSADANDGGWDWGFSLVPTSFLGDEYYLGWAPGNNNLNGNGSPLFVSAVEDRTTVFVDYSPADGTIDSTFTLDRLESTRIFDGNTSDFDNTGMHVFANAPFVAVWGQDSRNADRGSGFLDLGYTLFPAPRIWMDLVLTIDATVTPTVIPPNESGEINTWTLKVTSYDYDAYDVAVTDVMPTNFSYVDDSTTITLPDTSTISGNQADPSISSQTLTWSNSVLQNLDMGPDECLTITYQTTTNGSVSAGVYHDEAIATAFRESGTQTFSPIDRGFVYASLLTIDMDTSTPNRTVGEKARWTIELNNISSVTNVTGISLNTVLPSGFTFDQNISITETNATRTSTNNPSNGDTNLTWDTWTINAGGRLVIEFDADVTSSTRPATYDVTASATSASTGTIDDSGLLGQDSHTQAGVDPETDEDVTVTALLINKTTSTATVAAGNNATYKIEVTNASSTASFTGVTISDVLPSGFTLTGTPTITTSSATRTSTQNPSGGSSNLTWGTWTINGSGSVTIDFNAAVAAGTTPATYDNTASATSTETGPIDDTGNVGDDTDTPAADTESDEDVTVTNAALTVDVDTTTPGSTQGGTATWVISVVNTGSADATNVSISHVLPSGFTFDANTSISETDATRTSTNNPSNGASGTITWDTWTIDPGGSVVITFDADVGGSVPVGTYDSDASATSTQTGSVDDEGTVAQDADTPAGADPETDEDVTIVAALPDLDIVKQSTTDVLVPAGDTIDYRIEICNPGSGTATDVLIADTLPTGVSYVPGTGRISVEGSKNVADNFNVTSNGNNDGTNKWKGDWIEVDDNDPDNGSIEINGEVAGVLHMHDGGATGTISIARDVDLEGYSTATLDFTWYTTGTVEGTDDVICEISSNGGSTYTTLGTFTGGNASPGTGESYNIATYASADTRVRFRIPSGDYQGDERFHVEGLQIDASNSDPIRVTEYYIADGNFTGTTHTVTLTQDLESNYFVIIQGSDGQGDANGNRGPDENYARLVADPFGTGDLSASGNNREIDLQRGNSVNSWVGVVTVVECLADTTGSGFILRDVQNVVHSATVTSGTDTSGTAWSDIGQVVLFGGYNGAGAETSEANNTDNKVVNARFYPSGTNTINWTRDLTNVVTDTASVTSVVMVVEWGSEWFVQHANVTGNNGGNGVNVVGEYNTATLEYPMTRAKTWVWGTGHTNDQGIGDAGEGCIITLGDGVNENTTETTVAVGVEVASRSVDFDVYAMTHPDLAVDYVFKADGDTTALTVPITVASATSNTNRMALSYNTQNGTGDAYPRPMMSARYTANTTVTIERRRMNQPFTAWVQGIDFSGVTQRAVKSSGAPPNLTIAADDYEMASGESLVATFQVRVDDPLASSTNQLTNQASVAAVEQASTNSNSITHIVPHLNSWESNYSTADDFYRRDPESTGQTVETIYTGDLRYVASTNYDVAYYDAGGALIHTDTGASSTSGQFLQSSYANNTGTPDYGTWTAVAMPDGTTAQSTLAAQLADSSTLATDEFVVETWSTVDFTDSSGTPVTTLDNSGIYVELNDDDANTAPGAINSITVTVTDPGTGDDETITLYETGNDTGIFANNASGSRFRLPTSTSSGTSDNDGVLNITGNAAVNVAYTDATDSPDVSNDTVTVTTAAVIAMFETYQADGQVVVSWETASEIGTIGWHLEKKNGDEFVRLNSRLLPAFVVHSQGGIYRYIDETALFGETATYRLIELEADGDSKAYGPYTVTVDGAAVDFAYRDVEPALIWELDGGDEQFSRVPHRLAPPLARVKAAPLMLEARSGGSDMARIVVEQSGVHFVGNNQLAAIFGIASDDVAGLLRQNGLLLTNQGQPVAYLRARGDVGFYFYGEAIDSKYTTQNVYLVSQASGDEMAYEPAPGAGAGAPDTFEDTFHIEVDQYHLTTVTDDPNSDYWYWDFAYAGLDDFDTRTFTVATPGVAGSGTASLTVHLQASFNDDSVELDNHAIVSLNGQELINVFWSGAAAHSETVGFDPSLLNDGDNTIIVHAADDTGASASIIYIDSFDITTSRRYQAVNGALGVPGAASGEAIAIDGFTTASIYVMDISEPRQPTMLAGVRRTASGGEYGVRFGSTGGSAYHAFDLSAAMIPTVEAAPAPYLANSSNRADYVVIASSAFASVAQTLADYRQGQGHETMVVTLDSIMNEFNNGLFHVGAIRDFLAWAYSNWDLPPRYVVLAGRGTFDYRNIQGQNDNLMPVMLIDTDDGLFVSDGNFADVLGDDGIPEMAVGRLPAQNVTELADLITKIQDYEAAEDASWMDKVILLADTPGGGVDFGSDSDAIQALLPETKSTSRIYLGEMTIGDARTQLLADLNGGALMLNYLGHGNLERFADGGVLVRGDVDGLTNGSQLPIVAAMTCLVGYTLPGFINLSEKLVLHPGGGALAVWTASGYSFHNQAKVLNEEFVRAAFAEGEGLLGDYILSAISAYHSRVERSQLPEIYILFGDPATRVHRD